MYKRQGKKQSAILDAEAEKQAAILKAEAAKEKMIREAEGEAEAIRKVQQANAEGIRLIKEAGADQAVLAPVSYTHLDVYKRQGNLCQQLYTVVDTAVVGKQLGVDALAALGAVDWLNWLVLSVIQGFA